MKSIIPILILSVIIFSCDSKLDELEQTETVSIDNVEYQVVTLEPNDDINAAIQSNTLIQLGETGNVFEIDEDLIIDNKENIIISGNASTMKFMANGINIQIDSSENIVIRDLVIDNNNTHPGYIPTVITERARTGRIEVTKSSTIEISNVKFNKQPLSHHYTNYKQGLNQIFFNEVSNSIVSNCTIEESLGELILFRASVNCTAEQNQLNGGWSGVGTAGKLVDGVETMGFNNKVIENVVRNSNTAYITINDQDALVDSNTIFSESDSLGGPGIRFGQPKTDSYEFNAGSGICRNNIIKDLRIQLKDDLDPFAISIDHSNTSFSNNDYTDVIISGNKINNCTVGINVSVQPDQYVLIENNEVSTIEEAIQLFSPDAEIQQLPQNAYVSNNIILSQGTCVKMYNSSVTLTDNYISSLSTNNSNAAIFMQNIHNEDSSLYRNDIKIIDNIIELKGSKGIYNKFNGIQDAIISGNIIEGGYMAIHLGGRHNLITKNVIKNSSFRSIYLIKKAAHNVISDNHIYADFQNALYLLQTDTTTVFNNFFKSTSATGYDYAIWKSGLNPGFSEEANIFDNFTYISN